MVINVKRFWMTVVSVALLSVMLCGCSTLGALAGGLVKQETETQMEASAVETASPDPTAEPTATPAPTATPTAEPTDGPTDGPESTDDPDAGAAVLSAFGHHGHSFGHC